MWNPWNDFVKCGIISKLVTVLMLGGAIYGTIFMGPLPWIPFVSWISSYYKFRTLDGDFVAVHDNDIHESLSGNKAHVADLLDIDFPVNDG